VNRRLNACNISADGRCGTSYKNTYCHSGASCSSSGWCGVGVAWSKKSAQSIYNGSAKCVTAQNTPKTRVVQIKNVNSGKVLDVSGRNFKVGGQLIQYSNYKHSNQKFQMEFKNHSEFKLTPMEGQKLTAGNAKKDGKYLTLVDRQKDDHYYHLKPVSKGSNKFFIQSSVKCLDVQGASRSNSARVIFWDCGSEKLNQQWTVEDIAK